MNFMYRFQIAISLVALLFGWLYMGMQTKPAQQDHDKSLEREKEG